MIADWSINCWINTGEHRRTLTDHAIPIMAPADRLLRPIYMIGIWTACNKIKSGYHIYIYLHPFYSLYSLSVHRYNEFFEYLTRNLSNAMITRFQIEAVHATISENSHMMHVPLLCGQSMKGHFCEWDVVPLLLSIVFSIIWALDNLLIIKGMPIAPTKISVTAENVFLQMKFYL